MSRHTHSRMVLLSLGALAAAMLWPAAAEAITFSDATFNDADWELTNFSLGNGGTSTAQQVAAGGNPGEFRQVVNTTNDAIGGEFATVFGFHRHIPSIYDPGTLGAIASLDYSEDARAFADAFDQGQATGPALRQNGNVYIAGSLLTGTSQDWHTLSLTGLDAGDFALLANGLFDNTQHPDFSAAGDPIELGFFRGNSAGTGGYTLTAGIDNWSTVITPVQIDPPPGDGAVPEPALLGSLGMIVAGAYATRRRARR